MILKNKIALVTGSTRGFGYAVAQKFVEEGASVIVHGRNTEDIQSAIDNLIQKQVSKKQRIVGFKVDLSTYYGANILANKVFDTFERVDILVNNAGIQGAKGGVDIINIDEWIKTIEINLISVFKMCHYILPHMKQNGYGKIINLAGGGSTNPRPYLSAYAVSKAAIVRLTDSMAAECKDYHIDINAISPGALNTRILEEMLASNEQYIGKSEYEKALRQKESGGTPLELGANLCAFLASDKSDGITGKLISAKWDKWEEFPLHKDELMNSDIYTLKRIVAKDRDKSWDVEE